VITILMVKRNMYVNYQLAFGLKEFDVTRTPDTIGNDRVFER